MLYLTGFDNLKKQDFSEVELQFNYSSTSVTVHYISDMLIPHLTNRWKQSLKILTKCCSAESQYFSSNYFGKFVRDVAVIWVFSKTAYAPVLSILGSAHYVIYEIKKIT